MSRAGYLDVVELRAGTLAESPVWDEMLMDLYWVDITAGQVHRRSGDGQRNTWNVGEDAGCVVLRRDGGALVGLRNGIHTLDFVTGEVEFFIDAKRNSAVTRYNDGKCDGQGRLWIGTLDDADARRANLYRIDDRRSIAAILQNVTCSNGIDWSPDGRTFYWVDSGLQTVFAFDFDLEFGVIKNKRPFITAPPGLPDGIAVDTDGCIWCAHWDGWRVSRYSPDGQEIDTVMLPVARPTSVAFGGSNLDELYITSAKWKLSPENLASQPLAGALFVHLPGVRGFPTRRSSI